MKKEHTPYLVFGLITAVLLAYFILTREDQRRYQWNESYDVRSTQPYGTLFIRKMLENQNKKGSLSVNHDKPIHKLFREKTLTSSSDYYFIGQSLYLDKEDRYQLMKHIEAGNNAFIASLDPPAELLNDLHIDFCDTEITFSGEWEPEVMMNFFHDSLNRSPPYSYAYRYGSEDRPYLWSRINNTAICSESVLIPLGYHGNEQINFVRIPFGKGSFFLHCNPIVFTNYFISKDQNITYLSSVFSHLDSKDILWDEFGKIPYSINKNSSSSPLYFILEQPGLKYAWYIMLFTVALYVLFTMKRTQRIMPVLEPKSNSSLAFIQLVSTLYFENSDHLDMARKKMRYFLFFVRSRYGIHAHTFTEEHVKNLAERSGVKVDEIEAILDLNNRIENDTNQNTDATRLIAFYQAIEKFYKHCK